MMKKYYERLSIIALFTIIALFVSACNKTDMEAFREAELNYVCDEQSAMENFSISLSKAIFSYPEVREFLKTEALKRFDNDDEVFYPFIKDQTVGSLGSFREILIGELGSEEMMEQIEEEVPTLTILVSDATWFDHEGFCLDCWDTSDPYVAITYQESDGLCRKLFGNGCHIGTIEEGTIPGGPVLIVKENERVIASVSTRSGDTKYSFISDAFDARKNQPTTRGVNPYSWEWLNEAQGDNSNIVSASVLNAINPDIIEAYNLFRDNSYACHNDYIYYGMTSNATEGRLRTDVRSKIFRFKLYPNAFATVFDDCNIDGTLSPECNYVNDYEITDGGHGYEMQDSKETVYAKLWSDGALEICFFILAGSSSGQEYMASYSVKARDLFTVKNNIVKKEQWKATLIKWHISWRYSFNESGNNRRDGSSLNSKWYYPGDNYTLPVWKLEDLSEYSIKVVEVDRGITFSKEENYTTKHANSTTFKLGIEINPNGKLTFKSDLGWDSSDEETRSEKQMITWKNENDVLFTLPVSYSDKYIKSITSSGYELYTYGTNSFEFTILPYRY